MLKQGSDHLQESLKFNKNGEIHDENDKAHGSGGWVASPTLVQKLIFTNTKVEDITEGITGK